MNNQNPTPTPGQNTPPPAPIDWREQRRAERMARHEEHWQRHGSLRRTWIWGLILVFLGVALLFENLHIALLVNWWALFILIPAFWSYVGAWDTYQANSRITRRVASSLTVGILLTILAFELLLNLTVGVYWPVLLIAGGLALMLTGFFPE